MAVVGSTNVTPAIFREEYFNTTEDGLITDEGDLPVDNATVPWSGFDPPESVHDSCSLSASNYGIVAGIVAAICFLFGVLYTFFGEYTY